MATISNWPRSYEKNRDKNDIFFDWDVLHKFLEEYDAPNWIAYQINSGGYASYTVIYVVDKDVEVEEIIENKMDNED